MLALLALTCLAGCASTPAPRSALRELPAPEASPQADFPHQALQQQWQDLQLNQLQQAPLVAYTQAEVDLTLERHPRDAPALRRLWRARLDAPVFSFQGRITDAGQRALATLSEAWTHGAPLASLHTPTQELEALRQIDLEVARLLRQPLSQRDLRRVAAASPGSQARLQPRLLTQASLEQLAALEDLGQRRRAALALLDAALVVKLWRLARITGADQAPPEIQHQLQVAPEAALELLLPDAPDYHRLRQALRRYARLWKQGALPTLPEETPLLLSTGTRHPSVELLRQRLEAEGFPVEPSQDPQLFDIALARPLRAFQRTRGISASGLVDADTRAALRVPPRHLVERLMLGLRRWQRSPTRWQDRYVRVNAARFEVQLVYQGQLEARYPVVVGKAWTQTPRFSGVIDHLQVHPWWWGLRSKPQRVPPGPRNPLGELVLRVNPRHRLIYLHGTNEPQLFSREQRSFSHGCVRLEHPRRLAGQILDLDPGAEDSRTLETLLKLGHTRQVWLSQPLPVHFEYNTTFVHPQTGHTHFMPDIYQDDARSLQRDPLEHTWVETLAERAL